LLIKIDGEDSAGEVLDGAKTLMKCHRPIVICEVLRDDVGAKVKKALPTITIRI